MWRVLLLLGAALALTAVRGSREELRELVAAVHRPAYHVANAARRSIQIHLRGFRPADTDLAASFGVGANQLTQRVLGSLAVSAIGAVAMIADIEYIAMTLMGIGIDSGVPSIFGGLRWAPADMLALALTGSVGVCGIVLLDLAVTDFLPWPLRATSRVTRGLIGLAAATCALALVLALVGLGIDRYQAVGADAPVVGDSMGASDLAGEPVELGWGTETLFAATAVALPVVAALGLATIPGAILGAVISVRALAWATAWMISQLAWVVETAIAGSWGLALAFVDWAVPARDTGGRVVELMDADHGGRRESTQHHTGSVSSHAARATPHIDERSGGQAANLRPT